MRIQNLVLRVVLMLLTLGAVISFAALKMRAGIGAIDGGTITRHASLLAAAVVALSCTTLLLGRAWITLVNDVSARRVSSHRLMTGFLFAWLGRYIPGTVPFFAGKVFFARRLGYETRELLIATGVENVLELVVAATVGCAAIAAAGGASDHPLLVVVGIILAGVGVLTLRPSVFRRLTNRVLRTLHRDPVPVAAFPKPTAIATAAALIGINQVVNGLALLAVLHGVAGTDWQDAPLLIGATSLAGVVGLLVVIAPAGLGVRDGVITALLASRVAIDAAALAAILIRLLGLVSDLLLVALALLFDRISGNNLAIESVRAALGRSSVQTHGSLSRVERTA